MLNRSFLVKSMTGFGKVVAPAVVNRSQGLLVPAKLQLIRRARALELPLLAKTSVMAARSGVTARTEAVVAELVGSRNKIRPFEASVANGSKSVSTASF